MVANADCVMVRGRFSRTDWARVLIAADIVQIADGALVEDWNVRHAEATEPESKRACPMFEQHVPGQLPTFFGIR
jgi:hypothetical protein